MLAQGLALSHCSVLQLVAAAPGWHARYVDGGNRNLRAVALWALVDAQGLGRRIVGIAPDGEGTMTAHAEEADGFDRYVFISPSTTSVPGARGL